ncbi:protein LAZ1 [Tanacetum coccineum]
MPISCCNVLYKCISKIIANHIKEGIGDPVSFNQLAFVLEISDNILITQELMRNYHKRSGPLRCAFKVDIQKTYDTVDWSFLMFILVGFNFLYKMVRWIMVCVSSTSYYVCINGDIHGWLKDVLFLFSRGHPNPVNVIMHVLEELKNVSGLVSSIPKSTNFFCNVLNTLKVVIISSMPFAKGSLPVSWSALASEICLIFYAHLLGLGFILPADIIHDLEQLMRGLYGVREKWKKLLGRSVALGSVSIWYGSYSSRLAGVCLSLIPISKGPSIISVVLEFVLAATSTTYRMKVAQIVPEESSTSASA